MPSPARSTLRIVVAVALIAVIYKVTAAPFNGFDLSNSSIPPELILSGGPDKDGIPAIDNPRFISAQQATFLNDESRILGIEIDGVSKAYPIAILNWHEIVNDEINGHAYAITYCPLCGTGVAFAADIGDQKLDFGVSGLLYNSDVLLYDRQTESLWSQIMRKAISGELRGKELTQLPITHTSWSDWRANHPQTQVLSEKTGFSRDYRRDPYQGYEQSQATYFRVTHEAPPAYHPKERVLGLEIDGRFKAYPFVEIDRGGVRELKDRFAGENLTIHWDKSHRRAHITDDRGSTLPTIEGFWFAWFTFHPETEIYRHDQG
jgi:hypothetical protein